MIGGKWVGEGHKRGSRVMGGSYVQKGDSAGLNGIAVQRNRSEEICGHIEEVKMVGYAREIVTVKGVSAQEVSQMEARCLGGEAYVDSSLDSV